MKLLKAQELVNTLKNMLTEKYWGHIYYLLGDENLPENEREYEVYIEYNGEFNYSLVGKLINFLEAQGTMTISFATRQIIIW